MWAWRVGVFELDENGATVGVGVIGFDERGILEMEADGVRGGGVGEEKRAGDEEEEEEEGEGEEEDELCESGREFSKVACCERP